jgi:hypothetical protein
MRAKDSEYNELLSNTDLPIHVKINAKHKKFEYMQFANLLPIPYKPSSSHFSSED